MEREHLDASPGEHHDDTMRTTVTLEPDVAALLKKFQRDRGLSFKRALNEALRAALSGKRTGGKRSPVRFKTFSMGVPMVSLDKALALAAALEDDELVRKLDRGK